MPDSDFQVAIGVEILDDHTRGRRFNVECWSWLEIAAGTLPEDRHCTVRIIRHDEIQQVVAVEIAGRELPWLVSNIIRAPRDVLREVIKIVDAVVVAVVAPFECRDIGFIDWYDYIPIEVEPGLELPEFVVDPVFEPIEPLLLICGAPPAADLK